MYIIYIANRENRIEIEAESYLMDRDFCYFYDSDENEVGFIKAECIVAMYEHKSKI